MSLKKDNLCEIIIKSFNSNIINVHTFQDELSRKEVMKIYHYEPSPRLKYVINILIGKYSKVEKY